jgi:NADH:ubiquinone oxidoreductase subunit F (NADH-binding)
VAPPTGTWRLLAAWADAGGPENADEHLARFGPVPLREYATPGGRERLVEAVEASGLRGRGGGGFPTGRKLAAVASAQGRSVVVGNGCEGEPASRKDEVLVEYAPHLVVEGALVAAFATRANEVHLCVGRDSPVASRLARAAGELAAHGQHGVKAKVSVVAVPERFVASEESALVNYLNRGDARPTSKPPRVFERGVAGRPTYVGNFETLAHLALVARFGPGWYRSMGTGDSPGTALVTVDGAVRNPGVVEVPYGTTLGSVLETAGGATTELQALLVGGCAGSWVPWRTGLGGAPELDLQLSHESLARVGASVGVGSLIALPAHACGLTETALILKYLAGESAGQCGPCMFGLPAVAADFAAMSSGATVTDALVLRRVERRMREIAGRGACAHPDGALRLADSALRVFEHDVRQHLAGRPCASARRAPTLPLLQPGQRALAAR